MVPSVRARVTASVLDLVVIWAWLGTLVGVGALVRRRFGAWSATDRRPPLVAVDATAFAGTVLPVAGYFVATEAGRRRASIGKRLTGLALAADPDGAPVPPWRVAVRTGVKLAPWQLAHLSVARAIAGRGSPVVTYGAYALSLALAAASVVLAAHDPQRRALHDRIAGSRVVTLEPLP